MSGEKRQASDELPSGQLVKRPNLGPGSSTAVARYGASGENGALIQTVRDPLPSLITALAYVDFTGASNQRTGVPGDAAQRTLGRDIRLEIRPYRKLHRVGVDG